ncbi:unnamed protein product [Ectocarpus sp. 6 AP-2014]
MATPPAPWLPHRQGDLRRLRHYQVQLSRRHSHLRRSSAFKRTAIEANLQENGEAGQRAGARTLAVAFTPATGAAVGTTTSALVFSAFRVVLGDRVGGRGWLGSVRELQSVCFDACKECRKVVPVRLRVSDSTPGHLWKKGTTAERAMAETTAVAAAELEPGGSSGSGGGGGGGGGGVGSGRIESYGSGSSGSDCYGSDSSGDGGSFDFDLDGAPGSEVDSEDAAASDVDGSECSWSLPSLWEREAAIEATRESIPSPYAPPGRDVPPLRIAGIVWERSTLGKVSFGCPELPEAAFGAAVIDPLHGAAGTSTLKRITLSSTNTNLPPTTAVLDAKGGEINWPPSLEELTFGEHFNTPINQIAWPDSVQQLSFGRSFNQPIAGVSLPPSLQQLKFGLAFDQPIDGVGWPPRLRRLTFGARFNRHLVSLPSTLEQLTFGFFFDNRSVSGAVWPSTLRVLTFGHDFDTDIIRVAFPASLERLSFGFCFNRPVSRDGVGVAFPASLQQLSFGACFNQPVDDVVWPASLRRLAFGFAFRQSVDGWAWPAGLTHLSVSRWCSLSRIDVPTGVQLELN